MLISVTPSKNSRHLGRLSCLTTGLMLFGAVLDVPPLAPQSYGLGSELVRYDSVTPPRARVMTPSPPAAESRTFVAAPVGTNLLVNGSFESGLEGWMTDDIRCANCGANNTWLSQSGGFSPLRQVTVARPSDGSFAAMTDQEGAGRHILYQDFQVPDQGGSLSCDVYVLNQAEAYSVPASGSLDPAINPNQHFRVDLMDPGAPVDDVGSGVLRNLFLTRPRDPLEIVRLPGDPPERIYTTLVTNLHDFRGQKVRLRFAEVDNQFFFNVGVDNCLVAADEARLSSRGQNPVVATDAAGNSAVAWQEPDPSGDTSRIFAQLLDASGLPRGRSFEVAGGGREGSPTLALTPSGNLVVAWTRSASGVGVNALANGASIFGKTFDSQGNSLGKEFQVNTESMGDLAQPTLAVEESGFVVTWQSGSGVRGRRFTRSGSAREGEISVAGMGSGTPSVASRPNNEFVVIWEEAPASVLTPGADGRLVAAPSSTGGIFGVIFGDNGMPTGDMFQVNNTASGNPSSPDVAADDEGGFVVVWQQDMGGQGSDIMGQQFNAEGKSMGPEFVVTSSTAGDQVNPKVDANGSGAFAVVWEELPAQGGFAQAPSSSGSPTPLAARQGDGGIFGRVFGDNGQPMGDDFPVEEADDETVPAEADVNIDDDDEVTVVFEKMDPETGETLGIFSKTFEPEAIEETCVPTPTSLCLNGNRFRVEMDWMTEDGNSGAGRGVMLTPDTGYFWFFQSTNVEVVLKVLNACTFADRFWVFAGGLTNVEVEIRVADTQTGVVNTYINALNQSFLPLQDTTAFATCPGSVVTERTAAQTEVLATQNLDEVLRLVTGSPWASGSGSPPPVSTFTGEAEGSGGACVTTPTSLCVNDNRFRVEVDWTSPSDSGVGQTVKLTSDTGYFWFFNSENVEMVLKILNACNFSGHFWVFAGGLTNVEANITVTDTETGAVRFYQNPLNQAFQPIQDTTAFATCP